VPVQKLAKLRFLVVVAKGSAVRFNVPAFLLEESVILICVEHVVSIFVLDPPTSVIDHVETLPFSSVITSI
jgi:hypothetical protein